MAIIDSSNPNDPKPDLTPEQQAQRKAVLLEEKILKEANVLYTMTPCNEAKRPITKTMAKCVVQCWMQNVMPQMFEELKQENGGLEQ